MHDHDDPSRPPWIPPLRFGPLRPSPTMRVSDLDRREVTDALCRHFGDGRLDESELEDRLGRATAARTRADLAPLLADLPPLGGTPSPSITGSGPSLAAGRHLRRLVTVTVLGLFVLWTLAGAAAHLRHLHVGWLVVVLGALVVLDRSRARDRRRDRH
jgi:hypothetical protein